MAINDAKYHFTMVDIGGEGRQSDGGIFRDNDMGKRFEEEQFKLPNAKPIEIDGSEHCLMCC